MLRLLVPLVLLALPAAARADDSCQGAFNNACEEARFGGDGSCRDGTDHRDCVVLAAGRPNDTCEWADDGECDEPRFQGESGACQDGTDTTDCRGRTTRADALDTLFALLPASVRDRLGTDSCVYAHDLVCDDAAFDGTGACAAGTDATDCRGLAAGGDESCQYAGDGECDEPNIGSFACADGTDTADCRPVAYLRGRDDTCPLAFDGICNEPGTGDGRCNARTDTADCTGRLRPAQAWNHFFGRDDRYLVDATRPPFSRVGLLALADGGCSGALVGPRTVLTAAHCVTTDGRTVTMPLSFQAGLSLGHRMGKAAVVAAGFDPEYRPEEHGAGGGNGHDWALVTLDRDLGATLGWLPIHVLTDGDMQHMRRTGLLVDQAGYSWDTGENLSGNSGCRVTLAYADNSIQHECDITYGDSGSPLLMQVDGEWQVIGVVSQFFDPESKNTAFLSGSLAVDSRAFGPAVAAVLDGRPAFD